MREIASGTSRIAHRYDNVTVLQADMVGFTPLSAARVRHQKLQPSHENLQPSSPCRVLQSSQPAHVDPRVCSRVPSRAAIIITCAGARGGARYPLGAVCRL